MIRGALAGARQPGNGLKSGPARVASHSALGGAPPAKLLPLT